jgi:N-acylglucosamine-6-phosphate 2-epimerase
MTDKPQAGPVLDALRGKLIVSVQARAGSALDDPGVLAAIAREAQDAGAAGLRMQGVANIAAARARTSVPMIGIVKRAYDGFEPYITATPAEVEALLEAGVAIVAFDATGRPRPGGTTAPQLIEQIHAGGALAMADCADAADAERAVAAGADIVGSTLCGYTKETAGSRLPALGLVAAMASTGAFVICEGGVHTPDQGLAARRAGADALVVGTAITDVGWLVGEFSGALAKRAADGAEAKA